MDSAFTYQEERETAHENQQQQQQDYYKLKLCIPIVSHRSSSIKSQSLFSFFGFWVSKSVRNLCGKARFSNGVCLKRIHFNGMVVNNSVFCDWPAVVHMEEEKVEKVCSLEKDVEKIEEVEEKLSEKRSEVQTFGELIEEKSRESSSSSDFLTSETTGHEEEEEEGEEEEQQSHSSFEESFSHEATDCGSSNGVNDEVEKPHLDDRKFEKQSSSPSENEMMKERFSKLLLGEDMSGSGNGVCTALAISNAITNLCATLFGQLWRLEPVPHEKKVMWRREMEWLLSVSDHIVELIPSWQTFPDGSKLEVMTSRPRSDLYINLPALRKLDNMLLEILDSFENTEFWYVDQGILAPESDGSSSFRRALQRQEEKWWLPVPRVPPGGLDENSRKQLQHRRDSTNQILKAAMAINNIALTDMEVPESYLEALPKNGKACLGDIIYRYISSDQFSPDCLLECLDLSSEHQAIELANQVEASIYVWRKRPNPKPARNATRSSSKSSWDFVKELMIDGDKRELLADRAESLLLCLKLWFSGLPQTALDMSKIQYNKDVGKSVLESYSRVLESLAFNIIARIDDLLYVDDLTKHSDHFSSISKVSVIAHKTVTIPYSVPAASTPYKTAFTTPNFSPSNVVSPMKGERSPFMTSAKIAPRGFGVKKVLTDYLSIDSKTKDRGGDGHEGTNGSFRKGSFGRIDDMEHVKQGVSLKSSPTQNSSKEE